MNKLEAYRTLIEIANDFKDHKKIEAIEMALDSMMAPSDVMICRDCKYWAPFGRLNEIKRTGDCALHGMYTNRSYYCADAEVKE